MSEPSARWALVEGIFHEAMEKPLPERAAFLQTACGSDTALLREVESLLNQSGAFDSLLEHPPLPQAALPAPAWSPGAMLGPYLIVEPISAGGMGQVFRAHDQRMGRDVAIKVADQRFNDRFSREVRAVASLNHSHICHIHDVGPNYLVMELCEGETLAARLKRGKLSIPQSIQFGAQIASALSAAHAKGIVHRDLKPANIMLTPAGVKVLDFGVAKMMEPPTGQASPPGLHHENTAPGAIVGTAAYMSPEQAEGNPIDARSDIFSLGALLYEMASGQRAFPGGSTAASLSAVLHQEPAPLSGEVPLDLQKLIARCLRKDATRRLQHMDDISVALQELLEDAKHHKPRHPLPPPRRWPWWPAVAALLLFTLAAAFVYSRFFSQPAPPLQVAHLTSYPGFQSGPSFSPDGSQVAFSWDGEKQDNFDVYVNLVSGGPPLRLTTNPQRDYAPAWSPDGNQVAFVRNGFIYLISPLGGPERKLTKASGPPAWSPDGKYLAFSYWESDPSPPSIYIVSIATGQRRKVTSPTVGIMGGDRSCSFSPDGRSLAFIRVLNQATEIYILPLAGNAPNGAAWRLTDDKRTIIGLAWMRDSREIVYSSNRRGRTALWRIPVSPGAEPLRVTGTEDGTMPAISNAQPPRLAFQRSVVKQNIWLLDLAAPGKPIPPPKLIIASTGFQIDPRFSPDGKKIAFASNRSDNHEIWIADSTGANPVQLTTFAGTRGAGAPRWSPDGTQIAFDSNDGVHWDIFVIDAAGGPPRQLTDGASFHTRPTWSQDGRSIYFASVTAGTARQIWKIPSSGGKAVQVTRGDGMEALESPDGKTLYFSKGWLSPGIMSMPVNGGPESLVIPSASAGHWDVADNGIFFPDFSARKGNGPTPLMFFDFQTRLITRRGALDKLALSKLNNLSVTRDGRHAAWSQVDSAESHLMLVQNFR